MEKNNNNPAELRNTASGLSGKLIWVFTVVYMQAVVIKSLQLNAFYWFIY